MSEQDHKQVWDLYAAEWMCDWNWHSNEMTDHEIENFLNGLLYPAGFKMPKYIFKKKETNWAYAYMKEGRPTFIIPPRARNKRYLSHEVSHILGSECHDEKFAATELEVIQKVFGKKMRKQLEKAFKAKNVEWELK